MAEITKQQDSHKVGFTCGTFDLAHPGHLLMFEECKSYCDYLIVGLCVNPNTMQKEKNEPIETIFERFIRLRACRFIDEIFVYESREDILALAGFLYGKYGDNLIRFMDEKYFNDNNLVEYNLPIKVHFNSRKHNYSSTNLRKRLCQK